MDMHFPIYNNKNQLIYFMLINIFICYLIFIILKQYQKYIIMTINNKNIRLPKFYKKKILYFNYTLNQNKFFILIYFLKIFLIFI